jgi:hypothetical protein
MATTDGTVANETKVSGGKPRFARLRRAFIPLQIWLIVSALLLGRDWLKRMEAQTVLNFTLTGEVAAAMVQTKVDGQPFAAGHRVRLGKRQLVIEGPDIQTVTTNFFVWPGVNDLGAIGLQLTRGDLSIAVNPRPQLVRIQGNKFDQTHSNFPIHVPRLPTGDYQLTAVFGRHREQRTVRVNADEQQEVVILAPLGAAHITSEPPGAELFVVNESGRTGALLGVTPALVPYLPEGLHEIEAALGAYRQRIGVAVHARRTNEASVKFQYAEVIIDSQPPGATVTENRTVLGVTPLKLTTVVPGRHTYRVTLADHAPKEAVVEADNHDPARVTLVLDNLVFQRELSAAQRTRDVGTALEKVEAALAVKPDAAEALALKAKLEEQQAANEAKAAEQARAKKQQEAVEAFKRLTRNEKDAALFDTYSWVLERDLKDVQGALVRINSRADRVWTTKSESNERNFGVLFRWDGHGKDHQYKRAVVLVSELAPGAAFVQAKFWDYFNASAARGLLGRLTETQLVPLHPQSFRAEEKPEVERRRKAIMEDFQTRLTKELP